MNYLIDLDTAEVFVLFKRRYVRTGMFCGKSEFETRHIEHYIEEKSKRWREMYIEGGDTEVMHPRNLSKEFVNEGNKEKPTERELPGLPKIPDPSIYRVKDEVLRLETRGNFIRDRTRVLVTYILSHEETERWIQEKRYREEEAKQRLRIIYGRINEVRKAIEEGLQEDSRLRRLKNLPYLQEPKRHPDPRELFEADPKRWIEFIEEETDQLLADIGEAIAMREGMKEGTFKPLNEDEEAEETAEDETSQNIS